MNNAYQLPDRYDQPKPLSARVGLPKSSCSTGTPPLLRLLPTRRNSGLLYTPREGHGHALIQPGWIEFFKAASSIACIYADEELSDSVSRKPNLNVNQGPVGEPLFMLPVVQLAISPCPKLGAATAHVEASLTGEKGTTEQSAKDQCDPDESQRKAPRNSVFSGLFSEFRTCGGYRGAKFRLGNRKGPKHYPIRSNELRPTDRPYGSHGQRHRVHHWEKLFVNESPISLIDADESLGRIHVVQPDPNVYLNTGTINRGVGDAMHSALHPCVVLVASFSHKTTTSADGHLRSHLLASLSLANHIPKPPDRLGTPRHRHQLRPR